MWLIGKQWKQELPDFPITAHGSKLPDCLISYNLMICISLTKRISALVAFYILVLTSFNAHADSQVIEFAETSFTIFSTEIGKENLKLYWQLPDGSRFENADTLKDWLEVSGKKLIFATNAGIFSPAFKPLGLHIENGKELAPLNTKNGTGNFYLKPNGVFFITSKEAHIAETSSFTYPNDILFATQSGPLLVLDKKINSTFTKNSSNKVIRSGVGVKDKNNIIFAISNEKVNFYDFAILFRDKLDCSNALYLDGHISKMYLPSEDRLEAGGNFAGIFAVFE